MSFRSSSSSLTSLLSRRSSPSLLLCSSRPSSLSPLYLQMRTKVSSQKVPRMIKKQDNLQIKGTFAARLFFFLMACTACGATIWMNNPFNPAYPTIPYAQQPEGVKGSSSFEQERLEQGRKNGYRGQ